MGLKRDFFTFFFIKIIWYKRFYKKIDSLKDGVLNPFGHSYFIFSRSRSHKNNTKKTKKTKLCIDLFNFQVFTNSIFFHKNTIVLSGILYILLDF
jgi:hypothetical protein